MIDIPRIFCGFDQREAAGWHAFAQSVIDRASGPVALIPLSGEQRDGTNTFTYSRFQIPHLCNYAGHAIFVDGADMICAADILELWALRESWYAVQVVKHDYKTQHARKYVGTEMEADNNDYPRKNWSSVILWDCGHYLNRCLTPGFIEDKPGSYLHRFGWLKDDRIGELPAEWNWMPQEQGANTAAKLLHFTAGTPNIVAHNRSPHAQMWHYHHARSQEAPAEKRIAEVASAR